MYRQVQNSAGDISAFPVTFPCSWKTQEVNCDRYGPVQVHSPGSNWEQWKPKLSAEKKKQDPNLFTGIISNKHYFDFWSTAWEPWV